MFISYKKYVFLYHNSIYNIHLFLIKNIIILYKKYIFIIRNYAIFQIFSIELVICFRYVFIYKKMYLNLIKNVYKFFIEKEYK